MMIKKTFLLVIQTINEKEVCEVLSAYLAVKNKWTSGVFFTDNIVIGKISYIVDLYKNGEI
jgi:hypothetical protein